VDLIPRKKLGTIEPLLPGAGSVSFSLDKFLRIGIVAAASLLVVSLVAFGGFKIYGSFASKKIEKLRSEQAAVFTAADQKEAERIISMEKSAAALQTLLNKHIYVSEFFDLVSKYTLPRIQWTACVFNSSKGQASLSGEAGDYSTLAKQLLSFEGDETGFENIKIANVNLDRTGVVDFEMSLEIDSKKLQK